MFTASHNPAQYNGIKLCLAGRPAGRRGHRACAEIKADTLRRPRAASATAGTVSSRDDALAAFADARPLLRRPRARCSPLKVVADTANGMGGLVAPGGVRRPARSSSRSCTASSTAPSPTTRPIPSSPRTSVDLQARVLETGADVGLAFDGDADRVFLVDDQGELVSRLAHHGDRRRRRCCASTRAPRSSTT